MRPMIDGWETRKLWGSIIAEVRNLDLHVHVFIRESVGRENILSYAVAFAHLHRGQLCLADVRRDVSPWVGEKASDAMISQKKSC